MLLPAGTIFNRELIEKVRVMGLEIEAMSCLGRGKAPKGSQQADLARHYTRQRSATERVAEAFGSLRDVSFGLFSISAILAFAFTNAAFVLVAGAMLVAMLVNAWMSVRVLHGLSSLNQMFAGVQAPRY